MKQMVSFFFVCLLGFGCAEADGDEKADARDAGADAVAHDDPKAEWNDDKAARLYDEDAFETFDLVIDEANLAVLDADPTAEMYVEGALRFEDKEYPAGIRYKGSVGAWHKGGQRCVGTGGFTVDPTGEKTCQKLSFKVSFNEYDANGRFMGLRKVLFHSLNQDPSLMRERLAYELFRALDIAAPRASHARVLINGKFQGVYGFIEYVDGELARHRWSGGHGNLYKEIWPAGSDMFTPINTQTLTAGLQTNEDEKPSFKTFLKLDEALTKADGDDDAQLKAVSKWMDIDYLVRYIAADRATEHNDGILHFYANGLGNQPPWGNHNFYVYESEQEDRLWVIPWDMDNAWNPENPVTRIDNAWNDKDVGCKVTIPGGFGIAQIPPSCNPVIRAAAHDSLKDAFKGYVEDLLDGPLSEEVIDERIERWSALIADSVEEASHFDGELSVSGWESGKQQLRSAIALTRNNLRVMIGRGVDEAASITMNGYVTWPQSTEGVASVKVCLFGHKEVACTETDDTGAYSLAGVPAKTEQVLTFDRDDLVPVARNYNVPATDYTEAMMDSTGVWLEDDEVAPVVPRPAKGKGSVQLFPYGRMGGHTLTVSPDPGVDAEFFGVGKDGSGSVDPKLTKTTEAGLAILRDIEPGEYHAMFSDCAGFSAAQWGLPAKDGSSAVRFRIVPGYVLNAIVQICN